MALKFYMTPGSCSTGIHILLEHLELPFEVTVINLPAGDHKKPAYLAVNPRGTIPALQLNSGEVLTEWASIALWLARAHPRKQLLPEDPAAQAQAMGLLDLAVNGVHGMGYTRIFTTEAYMPGAVADAMTDAQREAWRLAVQQQGRELVAQQLAIIEQRLPAAGLINGERLGVADAALFYNCFWADKTSLPLPERCAAHYKLMRSLPVVRQVLAEEGYRS